MKVKNQIITTLTVATLLFTQVGTALADSTINVYLKGKLQTFEQSAIIKDGSTLVPMRAIFEALGATVKWDGKQQIIDATKGEKVIRLQIGWKGAWIGETKVALDAAPQIINGSTMVPLRFIGEALGEKVEWDSTSRSVLISTDKSQLPKADSGVYKGYATVMRDAIKSETSTGVKMPDATYKILESNSDAFFAANRDKFSLYDKAKQVSSAELSKKPAQYSSTIAEVNRIRIFEVQELTAKSGQITTMAYGESESGGLFFQIFYAGSKKLAKEDVIEMVGISAGKSQISVLNRQGNQYDAPVTVIVAGNIFTALEEYQLQAERGKGQAIEFDDEAQARLDKGKETSYTGEMGLVQAAEDGVLSEVQRLIGTNHVDANALPQNRTPLMAAALKGNDEIVTYLLFQGADPNLGYSFTSPLSSAAYSGKASTVKLLLQAGAVPNDFALSTARDNGYADILTLLEASTK
ncbi:stalk domain-containing protein [Paenibacillus sp. FSL P4-0338]|uniref:stalk domain-containing protein n=1 Tax=Paenibacillus sp. FSL P4-0338 TaxID=2921635 RepID=UPI0030F81D8A